MNDGRHPYFISIKRCDVINWQVSYERGRETVERVTVRQLRSVADEGYGTKVEPIYYVLTPGKVETFRLVKSESQPLVKQKIDEISDQPAHRSPGVVRRHHHPLRPGRPAHGWPG